MEWIISANGKMYDHASAFQKWGFIDWHQGNRKYAINDTIYIYCTRPIQRVMYKAVVVKINMPATEIVDDREFWFDSTKYADMQSGSFARLRLAAQANRPELHLDYLCKHGLAAAPQGAFKISDELKKYIDTYINDYYHENIFPDSDNTEACVEGAKISVNVNRYERSSIARKRCIEYHGDNCCVCGMNFESVYGKLGEDFIHVHHIKPLHEIDDSYVVDYKNDLIPVCPNCHAMLHRKLDKNTLTWQELKNLILEKKP